MTETAPRVEVASRTPFDFRLALRYFRRRLGELVDATDGDAYRRLLLIDGSHALVQVRAADEPRVPGVSVELLAGDAASLPAAAGAILHALGLDDDLDQMHSAFRNDAVLTSLFRRLRGLRLVKTQSAFEALVWAIIGQQINLTFAFRLKSALVQSFGESLLFEGQTYWAFPQPERLAGADEASLAVTGLGRRKAATLVSIARAVAKGQLDLEALATIDRGEAVARLIAIPGVGPWTAHYTLLRGLGDFGAFPASDLGLRMAAGRLYCAGEPASLSRMRQLAEEWDDWRGYVAFYLWNSPAENAT